MRCNVCGLGYGDFRTGITFKDVYYLIYARKWKRRNGVLGYWRQLKLEMFEEHIKNCGHEPAYMPEYIGLDY